MLKLWNLWARHYLFFDALLCWILAATFYLSVDTTSWFKDNNREPFYVGLATVFIVLMAMNVLASLVLATQSKNPRLALVMGGPHVDTLWQTFRDAVAWSCIASLLALLQLAGDPHTGTYFFGVSVFIALARNARSLWILKSVTYLIADTP